LSSAFKYQERLTPEAALVSFNHFRMIHPGTDLVHHTRAAWGREYLTGLGCNGLLEVQIPCLRVVEMLRVEGSN
jgi:hypothetical protein